MVNELDGNDALLIVPAGDGHLTSGEILDLLAEAAGRDVTVLAVPVQRLDPAFFDLASGVAGELVQRLANYRIQLAVVGELPAGALGSRSFTAFVREGNRRATTLFAPSVEDLRRQLASRR